MRDSLSAYTLLTNHTGCFVESGIPFDPSLQAPTAIQYGEMDNVSPLKLAQNVEAATLLLAGADDQRVPNQQTRVSVTFDIDTANVPH